MPDPVSPQPPAPQATPAEIDALVLKHHAEIDRIQALDSAGQQLALQKLGVDPQAVADHYKDLFVKSEELRREDVKASRNTEIMGWTSAAAAAGGSLAAGDKLGSKIVRTFAIPFITLTAGVLGVFTGSRLFSGNIRERSRKLDIEARNAFNRELAVALENRDRTQATAAVAEVADAAAPAPPAATNVVPRDASFTAQAAAEKTAAAGAGTQRA